jgi:hypothetical protein
MLKKHPKACTLIELNDGAYSLMVKLRSVAAAIRVQFPLGTQILWQYGTVFESLRYFPEKYSKFLAENSKLKRDVL